jgi:hypothetical protein
MIFRVYCGGGKHLGDVRLVGSARLKCAATKLDNYLRLRCVTGLESMFRVRRGGWLGIEDRNLSGTNARLSNLGFRCVRRKV